MRFYHRTDAHNARSILREGFRDTEGQYMTLSTHRGVWLSDRPLDANEGADGDTLLVVELDESHAKLFEWLEEEKGYREFLVPAAIINAHGKTMYARKQ